ncbi:ISAs1 family transposase [Alkalinema pantanalense CENA528]|uniref:ISAs1 family transposase n=1 Tax=Alkalinema pantanalense TaxID=1620705 RepID=UPI003D6E2717
MAVKGNQPTLLKQLQAQFEQLPPSSVDHQDEQTRDRVTRRAVIVLDQIPALDPGWVGIQRIIRVERSGTRAQKPYHEVMFYISSLPLEASGFAQFIRHHWHIENRLHWVKDVILKEDETPVCDGNALINFVIVRTLSLNLFRLNGFASITRGLRFLAHDVRKLFSFFQ